MNHRRWFVAFLLLSVLASACRPAPTPAALRPVRLCYGALAGSQIVLWYAYEQGIFQKYGLQPEIEYIPGSANAVAAMLGGGVDFCLNSGNSMVNAVAAGEGFVLIETLYDRILFELVAGPQVQTPQDLIGKGIAISQPRGIKDVAARLALAHYGLIADEQVALVTFRDNDEPVMAATVQDGAIGAAVLAPPLLSRYQEAGLRVMLDISTLDVPYQRLGLVTTTALVRDDRALALDVVRATLDAIAQLKRDPVGAQAALAKYLELDTTADAVDLAALYDIFVTRYLASVPWPSEVGLQAVINEMVVANPAAAELAAADLIDDSLLRELQDSGFIASLEP